MIKTFRGKLADGGQERIRLQTIKGKVGYKIVKFQIMAANPFTTDFEFVCQIWKKEQSTVTGTPNFTDSDLLGVALMEDHDLPNYITTPGPIIFDQETFNQDIYVTLKDMNTGESCNYYFELEVIELSELGAEYTTLKDLRTGTSTF